jgi:DNA-binding PadR family transcriptional regulator
MSPETDSGGAGDRNKEIENLDWKSQEILRAIYKNDGSATTSQIRALTGIDSNDQILYRFREKLVPRGLVELEQPESETARPEPKIASFTQQGVEVVERIIDERAAPVDLESRVDKLEADVSRVTDQMDEVRVSHTADNGIPSDVDVAELDEKTDQLLYQMGLIADFLNEKHDGGLSAYRAEQEDTTDTTSAGD